MVLFASRAVFFGVAVMKFGECQKGSVGVLRVVKRRNLCSDAVEGGGAPADRLRVRGSVQSERFSTTFPLDAVSSDTGDESLHEQNSGSIFINFLR